MFNLWIINYTWSFISPGVFNSAYVIVTGNLQRIKEILCAIVIHALIESNLMRS